MSSAATPAGSIASAANPMGAMPGGGMPGTSPADIAMVLPRAPADPRPDATTTALSASAYSEGAATSDAATPPTDTATTTAATPTTTATTTAAMSTGADALTGGATDLTGAASGGIDSAAIDVLAHRVYPAIARRIRAELRLDRERLGGLADRSR